MEIKVLGSGCSRCKKALELVNKVVKDNGLDAKVEYIDDIMKIMEYNVMSTPAIVVNNEVKIKGSLPSESEIKKILDYDTAICRLVGLWAYRIGAKLSCWSGSKLLCLRFN